MSNFSFTGKSQEVYELINKILSELSFVEVIDLQEILENFKSFWSEYQKQPKLTVAFIGQYNAGKSTLIRALTGNSSIRISAEICTDEVTGYEWEDVLLLDTPGIYAGRTDHDSITLDYISKSDLIVFVLPNELFNPQGAAFFKKVVFEMQRAGQMILVVNKMSRETGSLDDLLKTIAKVTNPHLPKAFNPCFIDADFYLKAQNPKYAKYKERLIEKSNLLDVQLAIEELIQKNKVSARLVTPLHRLKNVLLNVLDFCSTGKQNSNIIELLNRQVLLFTASQARAKNIYVFNLNQLEHEISLLAEEQVISLIDGHHSEEKINQAVKNSELLINNLVQDTQTKIITCLEDEAQDLQRKLKELMESSLGREIARELAVEFSSPAKVNSVFFNSRANTHFAKLGAKAFRSLEKIVPTVSRNLVYKLGKTVGFKFKPFGAFKAAKFIRNLSPLLAVAGVLFEAVAICEEQENEKQYDKELKQCRTNVRTEYQNLATQINADLAGKFKEALEFYNQEVEEVQQQIDQIKDAEIDKNKLIQMIEIYLNHIKKMIDELSS